MERLTSTDWCRIAKFVHIWSYDWVFITASIQAKKVMTRRLDRFFKTKNNHRALLVWAALSGQRELLRHWMQNHVTPYLLEISMPFIIRFSDPELVCLLLDDLKEGTVHGRCESLDSMMLQQTLTHSIAMSLHLKRLRLVKTFTEIGYRPDRNRIQADLRDLDSDDEIPRVKGILARNASEYLIKDASEFVDVTLPLLGTGYDWSVYLLHALAAEDTMMLCKIAHSKFQIGTGLTTSGVASEDGGYYHDGRGLQILPHFLACITNSNQVKLFMSWIEPLLYLHNDGGKILSAFVDVRGAPDYLVPIITMLVNMLSL